MFLSIRIDRSNRSYPRPVMIRMILVKTTQMGSAAVGQISSTTLAGSLTR